MIESAACKIKPDPNPMSGIKFLLVREEVMIPIQIGNKRWGLKIPKDRTNPVRKDLTFISLNEVNAKRIMKFT
jgi:hypothetical protein